MSSSALSVVASAYHAFAAGDVALVSDLLAEVEWVEAEGMPYGGCYSGAQAVFENVLGPIAVDVQEFSAKPDELLPIGADRVLSVGAYRGKGKNGLVDVPFAHLWTVHDGRITRFVQYADTAKFREAVGK